MNFLVEFHYLKTNVNFRKFLQQSKNITHQKCFFNEKKRKINFKNRLGNSFSFYTTRNCDVNVKSFEHKSTLMLASELAEAAILKLILRKCSDWQLVFCDGGRGASPLQVFGYLQNNLAACIDIFFYFDSTYPTHCIDLPI